MNSAAIEKYGKFVRAVLPFPYLCLLKKDDELEILLYVLGTSHNNNNKKNGKYSYLSNLFHFNLKISSGAGT